MNHPITVLLFGASFAISASAADQSTTDAMRQADIKTRATWACETLGLAVLKKDGVPGDPDKLLLGVDSASDPTSPPTLRHNTLTGVGMYRTQQGWTDITFSCTGKAGFMKAARFSYQAGKTTPFGDSDQ